MKTNKARGPNSIPTKILKLFKKEFSKPLSDIINLSFNQGVFPNLLKIANVIPIHKKGDKLDCNNYRPISLLSNISKIFEKCMHTRLTNFLRVNKILFSHQFGFRNWYVKPRIGIAPQVDSVQLGNPVLAPDFKLDPSWLHFYYVSEIDSREHNLCSIMKQQLILKTLDMIKLALLRKLLF